MLANYGILRVVGPDRWLWLGLAVVLMVTGAVGVIISDSPRRVSVWSVVGFEFMIVFTLAPLLWMFTIAAAPDLGDAHRDAAAALRVVGVRRCAGGRRPARRAAELASGVLRGDDDFAGHRRPGCASLIRERSKLASRIYLGVVTLILAPLIVFQGAIAEQLRVFGLIGFRLAPVIPMLLLTVPLATWLCVTVLRDVPWTLRDAIRVEGASTGDEFRRFVVPIIGPGLLVAAFIDVHRGTE